MSFITVPNPITVSTLSIAPAGSVEFGMPYAMSAPRTITVATSPERHCASSSSQSAKLAPLVEFAGTGSAPVGFHLMPPSWPIEPSNVFNAYTAARLNAPFVCAAALPPAKARLGPCSASLAAAFRILNADTPTVFSTSSGANP